jgi:hypothetical protein
MVYIHNGILLSQKEERYYDMFKKMDRTRDQVKWIRQKIDRTRDQVKWIRPVFVKTNIECSLSYAEYIL